MTPAVSDFILGLLEDKEKILKLHTEITSRQKKRKSMNKKL